ncbi:F-box protein At1g70590 [Amaranthus tricolor]|uniref:F-box protein At1g70590 n=1 Tax=Amaranthus tricolor TaxID=29722 RepID=UPI0025856F4A|nr:F-box protein At1g70590 [Amaranthus tricolor]
MKQKTWPSQSRTSPFSALPLSKPHQISKPHNPKSFIFNHPIIPHLISSPSEHHHQHRDFSSLPYDLLNKVASGFSQRDLNAASLVCKSWNDGLRPMREAMLLLRWGKRFKHGRAGVRANLDKALDSFLKGAARGSSLAMVDAGLVYWEMGKREEGVSLYRKAAELGDPAGQCNLALAYLQADFANPKEAVKLLLQSASAGHVRAQYQLALCLHHGRGIARNIQEAAKWYLRAAEGGYVRAMYNVSLCYSVGEGFAKSHPQAKKWMRRAADHGHGKAQFEHGLNLFSEGDLSKAVVYLELASRAGETGASHVKDVIIQQLSAASRERAMRLAENWRALPSSR